MPEHNYLSNNSACGAAFRRFPSVSCNSVRDARATKTSLLTCCRHREMCTKCGVFPILHRVFLWVLCVRFSMPVQAIFRFLDRTDSRLCRSLIRSCGERCVLSRVVSGCLCLTGQDGASWQAGAGRERTEFPRGVHPSRGGLPVQRNYDLMGAEGRN